MLEAGNACVAFNPRQADSGLFHSMESGKNRGALTVLLRSMGTRQKTAQLNNPLISPTPESSESVYFYRNPTK